MDFKQMGKNFLKKCEERSPDILAGIGISGFFTAMYLYGKAKITANELIEERKLDERRDTLTKKEEIQTTWKCYIPTAITAGGATACIVASTMKNNKRNAALAAAYSLSQETLTLTRQKIIETLGEKKECEIREQVDRERIERHPVSTGFEVNPFPPDSLFEYNGRYFCSTWDNVRAAVNQLGEDMLDSSGEPEVTENDWFELVGLPYERDAYGRGWNLHYTGRPELYPPSCIELPNHQICFVLSFRVPPIDLNDTRNLRRV